MKADIHRLWQLFKPYKRLIAVSIACMLAVTIVTLFPAIIAADIIDRAIPSGRFASLLVDVAAIFILALTGSGLSVVLTYVNALVSESIMRDVRVRLLERLFRAPLQFFDTTRTGELMNRASSDVDTVGSVLSGSVSSTLSHILTLAVTLPAIFIMNWRLSLLAIALVPLMFGPLPKLTKKMYDAYRLTREARDDLDGAIGERLSSHGITTMKLFVSEASESAYVSALSTTVLGHQLRMTMLNRWFSFGLGAVNSLVPALAWLYGGWMIMHGDMKIGSVVALLSFIQGRVYPALGGLAGLKVQLDGARAVFDRIFSYMAIPQEESAEPPPSAQLSGPVTFANVSFSYGAGREALTDVSFEIKEGEHVALVGASGAGKSTVARLLCRLYEPSNGVISIGAADISDVSLETLRSRVGVVSQDVFVFAGTVLENICYGSKDVSTARIEAALTIARLEEFVRRLPRGLHSLIGERGSLVSPGERQRISIARAVLRDTPILILDEATSALDAENDALVTQALADLRNGRTCLTIAHRLSSVRHASRILVFDQGALVELGTHEELMASRGKYFQLYSMQGPILAAS